MLDDKEPQPTINMPSRGSEKDDSDLERPEVAQVPKEETNYYLTGSKLYLILAGIGLTIYLFALDVSVISTVSYVFNGSFQHKTDWFYRLFLPSLSNSMQRPILAGMQQLTL